MTLFIQNNATGAGAGTVDATQAQFDLGVIANGDTGLGLAPVVGNRQQVTYARTDPGAPATRLATLVNTNFNVNPQNVDIVVVAVGGNFTLADGRSILTVGGTALAPAGSPLPGGSTNPIASCVVLYDTSQHNGDGWCLARAGTGGTLDLQTPNAVILFHELSHAFRIVTNALLALTATCNPSSPEEAAAIADENQVRTQIAAAQGVPAVLRDTGIHCGTTCTGGTTGGCCIVASVATGSPLSSDVSALRLVRDRFVRRTQIGHAFFEQLHYDYYAFSPQIAATAAGDLQVRRLIRDGFVQPLISVLGLIEAYTLQGADPIQLGRQFAAAHGSAAAGRVRLESMTQAADALLNARSTDAPLGAVADLLIARGLRSEHIRWALMEPVAFYHAALLAHVDGAPAESVGAGLAASIDNWSAMLPIDPVWGSLSLVEVRDELRLLERRLHRTTAARERFRARLADAHGDSTAVVAVLAQRRTELS